jgi:hypothetical protein
MKSLEEQVPQNFFATKNLGDAHRVPMVALLRLLNAFWRFSSLLSF